MLSVEETNGILLSSAISCPIFAPPQMQVKMALGKPFLSNTSAMSFVVAIEINGVVGAPFQTTQLPQTKVMYAFHPSTSHGKLNAVITHTIPRGFQTSIII